MVGLSIDNNVVWIGTPCPLLANLAPPDKNLGRCQVLLGWVTKCLSENEDRSVEDETVIRDSDLFRSYWRCENLLGLCLITVVIDLQNAS